MATSNSDTTLNPASDDDGVAAQTLSHVGNLSVPAITLEAPTKKLSSLCPSCAQIDFHSILRQCHEIHWQTINTDYRLQNQRHRSTPLKGVHILSFDAKYPQTCGLCSLAPAYYHWKRPERYEIHVFEARNWYTVKGEKEGLTGIMCGFEDGRGLEGKGAGFVFGIPNFSFDSEILWNDHDFFSVLTNEKVNEGAGSQLNGSFPREVGQYVDGELVKHWLKTCSQNHIRCGLAVKEVLPGLRLIDCHQERIIAAPQSAEYIALSYVWGRREVFPFDKRPSTVRDAMALVLQLGKRYLWVDKYCIIQGPLTQKEKEDKEGQINAMGRIYGDALATVVAAEGTSEDYGLPGVTTTRTIAQHVLHTKDFTIVRGYWGLNEPQQKSKSNITSTALPSSSQYWNQRGWTFQEGMLSNRLIFLLNTELYFECQTMACRESDRSVTRKSANWGEPISMTWSERAEMARAGASSADECVALKHFWQCIVGFSTRTLTYDEDILLAFQGIMDAFESGKNGLEGIGNLLGIPLRSVVYGTKKSSPLLVSLGWERLKATTSKDHLRRVDHRTGGSMFPSWTWAAWNEEVGPPRLLEAERWSDFTPLATVQQTTGGQCLCIEAPLFESLFATPATDRDPLSGYTSFEEYYDTSGFGVHLAPEGHLDELFQQEPDEIWDTAILYRYHRSGSLDPEDDGER